ISRATWGIAIAVSLALALGNLTVRQLAAIRDQALIQQTVYSRLEELSRGRTPVVLAPRFQSVWRANRRFRERGSWVFHWRRPEPDLSDPILIFEDVPGAEPVVRRLFPARPVLRLDSAPAPDYLRLEALPAS